MNGLKMFTVVGLALFAGAAWGQVEVEWERMFGGGSESCSGLISTADIGFALGGTSHSFEDGRRAFRLVRTDENGDSLWAKTFTNGIRSICEDVIQTADGGFALVGETTDTMGLLDSWLVKTDDEGNLLWERSYGKPNDSEICSSIIQTSDGGFAMAGYCDSNINRNTGFWFLRIDEFGDSLWLRTFNTGRREECRSLIQTADGGFALGGVTLSDSGFDMQIIRTDENGESLWLRTYGSRDNSEICSSLIQTLNGGFALAGYSVPYEARNSEFFVVCTDSAGDSLWSKTFGGHEDEYCRSLIQTKDGGFLLAGTTQSFGAGWYDIWLVRTDGRGDSLWSVAFGRDSSETCNSVVQTVDGGFALAGSSSSFWERGTVVYILKTTPDPVSVRNPVSPLTPSTLLLALAYPNPFNSTTRIEFGLSKLALTRVQIFDPLGRRVADLMPPGTTALREGKHSVVWNATGVPAGEYLIRLQAGEQSQATSVQVVK